MRENSVAMHPQLPVSVARLRVGTALVWVLIFVLLGAIERLPAQGIERESLAGESTAAAARGSDTDQPYNLRLGPVTIRADASLATSYNDNINVAHTGRLSDVIITPAVDIHALWQATDLNALTLDLGLGYQWYTIHSGNSSLNITPNSQTQFNIYVDDFKINLHDRFSFSQDPIVVGQLSNVSQFPVFVNIAGLQVDWDLGDIILSLGYDHTNQWVFNGAFNYLSYQADTLSPRISFKISKTIETGITTSVASMRYDQNIQNNNTSVKAGPFVTAQITENLSVDGQAGGVFTNYDTGGTNGDTSNLAAFYGSAGISHRINDVLSESLTGGREFIPGISSNYTQRVYANYTMNWNTTSYFTVGSNLWWENLDDSNATFRQTADRYGAGLSLAYHVADHANISLGYQYVLKDANPSILSYSQDVATLQFTYQY